MKKAISIIFIVLIGSILKACTRKDTVVIYSSNEDYRNDQIIEDLKKEFPSLNISLQYFSTGTHAAKLAAEGLSTEADIFLDLEVGFAENLIEYFAELKDFDISNYLPEVLPSHNKYHIWAKEAGSIILNSKVLKDNNLPEPTSYADLLDTKYKELVMMPNPKSSGTGYFFYNSLVANWGEQEALDYFDQLSKIVKQFSESGSGPVKALDKGEIAVGLGMTFQAVQYVSKNPDLKIIYFEEGSPYTLYAMGIIKGKETNKNVLEVYKYLFEHSVLKDKELFVPEVIFKNQQNNIENYPNNVIYSKMNNLFSSSYKESLLDKWKW